MIPGGSSSMLQIYVHNSLYSSVESSIFFIVNHIRKDNPSIQQAWKALK